MQKLQFQIQAWIQYQLRATGKHGIHSPFVYQLYEQAILPGLISSPETGKIEGLRKQLLKDSRILAVEDFGAGLGGKEIPKINRPISKIAGSSARGLKFGSLLFRLSQFLKPHSILEMGTNLGLSTLYLSKGNPNAQLMTLEGSKAIGEVAQEHFQQAHINPTVVIGEFSSTLESIDWSRNKPDFIFVDGNHRQEPTVAYFKFLMSKAADQAVFIFDDIHWSPGMQAALDNIRSDTRVQVSIDLYGMGICFTGRDQAKEHFILKF
jgi:predicted O-methyltransferase YrrM